MGRKITAYDPRTGFQMTWVPDENWIVETEGIRGDQEFEGYPGIAQDLNDARREVARLKAERDSLLRGIAATEATIVDMRRELESQAWDVSPAMAQAQIDNLNHGLEYITAQAVGFLAIITSAWSPFWGFLEEVRGYLENLGPYAPSRDKLLGIVDQWEAIAPEVPGEASGFRAEGTGPVPCCKCDAPATVIEWIEGNSARKPRSWCDAHEPRNVQTLPHMGNKAWKP